MKRFLLKIGAIILLSISIVFGSSILPSATSNPLTQSAYAIPLENPDGEAQDTPDTNDQDDAESNTDAADTNDANTDTDADTNGNGTNENVCQGQAGSVSWILCPLLNTSSGLVDGIYGLINNLLVIQPISTNHESGIYKVWQKACEITNIIFVIFMLIVIYSQITGFGVNNYGIKRILPRLIIAVIMVNLSFFITSLLVDVSNLVGSGAVKFFTDIQSEIQLTDDPFRDISWSQLFGAFTGSTALGFIAIEAMGGFGWAFWMLAIALVGALISVVVGLITISLRQGVVMILIMIAPLAFVSYLLPNTEKWFEKWKSILAQMLFFYPMFAFLYGASKLAGWAIIATANSNPVFVILGFAVQVMPLFLSVSLMKMSGTVLGGVNNALNRLTNPLRNALTGYGVSHAELSRMKHLENNRVATGARLQNYLSYRKMRREMDTEDLKNTIAGRNLARTYRYRSSSKGLDKEGRGAWSDRPNKSTEIAKKSSLQNTITSVSQQDFINTLGEYGDVFKDKTSKELGAAHGEAFLDMMKQQFRAENIAQADQNFLLGRFLGASKSQYRNPYEFNRLIMGASGRLGHTGEQTIMGQVIKRSAEIEDRRRAEAKIVTTKFGYSKGNFRSMQFDKASINDDGYEEDENGNVIEDELYRFRDPITGEDTSYKHRGWGQYIGVHKHTNQEITKEQYDALDPVARSEYKKLKYMEIFDDENDVVQRVFEDDAGYMKEMIRQDIAIGDPINLRYASEIGLKFSDAEIERLKLKFPDIDWSRIDEVNKSGKLRRFHSTISGALRESNYAEHAGEFTGMLISQLDSGYVLNANQRIIAGLSSMINAAKTGKLFQNDAINTKNWERIVRSLDPDAPEGQRFEDYFDDLNLVLARNVNGLELNGLRRTIDEDGHLKWKKIQRTDPTLTIDDVRNWIKHNVIPDFVKKIAGSANRTPSQEVLNNLKPEGVDAFISLLDTIGELGVKNLNEKGDTPFDELLNPEKDIFGNRSPSEIATTVRKWASQAREIRAKMDSSSSSSSKSNNYDSGEGYNSGDSYNNDNYNSNSYDSGNGYNSGGKTGSGGNVSGSSGSGSGSGRNNSNSANNNTGGASSFNKDLSSTLYDDKYHDLDYDTAIQDIREICSSKYSSLQTVCQTTLNYFRNHSPLNGNAYYELENIVNYYIADYHFGSTYEVINNVTDPADDRELIEKFEQEVITIINHTYMSF